MARSTTTSQQGMQFPLQGFQGETLTPIGAEGFTGFTPQQLVPYVMKTYVLAQEMLAQAMGLFGGLQYLAGVQNITPATQGANSSPRANRTSNASTANTSAGSSAVTGAPKIDAIVLEGINLHPEGCTTPVIRDWVINYLNTNYPGKVATIGQVVNALNRHWRGQRIAAVGEVGNGQTPQAWYPLNSPQLQEVGASTGPGTKASQGTAAQGTTTRRRRRAA